MPLYEFRCERCQTVKEVLFGSSRDAEENSVWCDNPDCKPAIPGGVCRMQRQPSAPAFAVNGYNAKNGYSSEC